MTSPTSIEIGTPLFSIVQSGGSYEDAYQVAVFVTHDEKAANAYVERQNATYESMRVKREQSRLVATAWKEENPCPRTPDTSTLAFLPIPSWKEIKHITPEMRAERARIKADNDKIIAAAQKPVRDWFTAHFTVLKDWENVNVTDEEKVAAENDNHTQYDVQALDWLP